MKGWRASLVAHWLRTHLPMQGTRLQSLIREDPTCPKATQPVCHNYWACALEPGSRSSWSPCAESLCSATREATAMRGQHTTTIEYSLLTAAKSPRAVIKTQCSQKWTNKQIDFFFLKRGCDGKQFLGLAGCEQRLNSNTSGLANYVSPLVIHINIPRMSV